MCSFIYLLLNLPNPKLTLQLERNQTRGGDLEGLVTRAEEAGLFLINRNKQEQT